MQHVKIAMKSTVFFNNLAASSPMHRRADRSGGRLGRALVLALVVTAWGQPVTVGAEPAPEVSGGLPLRLDLEIRSRVFTETDPAETRVPVTLAAELHRQVERLQRDVAAEGIAHDALSRLVHARERHIEDLQHLLAIQDEAILLLSRRAESQPGPQDAVVRVSEPLLQGSSSVPTGYQPAEPGSTGSLISPSFRQVSDNDVLIHEDLVFQTGVFFVVAVLLSLGLYLRSRLAVRRYSALDAEIQTIIRERDDSRAGREVTEEMLEAVRRKSKEAAELSRDGSGKATFPNHPASDEKRMAERAAIAKRLKEVDTLIAFEDYQGAAGILKQLVETYPNNPEVRLRLLHVQSAAGDPEATLAEERILSAMMDGPLSDTMRRVRQAGREMLPEHPLFAGRDKQGEPANADGRRAAPTAPASTSKEVAAETSPGDPIDMLATVKLSPRHGM